MRTSEIRFSVNTGSAKRASDPFHLNNAELRYWFVLMAAHKCSTQGYLGHASPAANIGCSVKKWLCQSLMNEDTLYPTVIMLVAISASGRQNGQREWSLEMIDEA